MKNMGISVLIATTALHMERIAILPGIYFMAAMILGAPAALIFRWIASPASRNDLQQHAIVEAIPQRQPKSLK